MEDSSQGLWSLSQELITDSYPHSHKAVSVWNEGHKKYFFKNQMLNLKNIENDAVFDEIC